MGGQVGTESNALGVLGLAGSQAADPWLWLAGLSVCRKREGVPLPRTGGGWEGADASAIPYKHRLAHDPGRRSRSGRAFRCVGFLGRSPKPLLHPFVGTKGCPRRVGVQTKFSIKLAPPKATTNYFTNTPAVAVQIMITKRLAPPIGDYNLFHARQPSPKIANFPHQIAPSYNHKLVVRTPHL